MGPDIKDQAVHSEEGSVNELSSCQAESCQCGEGCTQKCLDHLSVEAPERTISPFVVQWFVDHTCLPGQKEPASVLREQRISKFEKNPIVSVMRFNKKEKRLEQGFVDYRAIVADGRRVVAELKAEARKGMTNESK